MQFTNRRSYYQFFLILGSLNDDDDYEVYQKYCIAYNFRRRIKKKKFSRKEIDKFMD
jgi:hypothetical protein